MNQPQGHEKQALCLISLLFFSPLLGFLGGAVVKNLPAVVGDTSDRDLILGLGISPGVGNSRPLQCSCLEWTEEPGGLQSTGLTKSQMHTCSLLSHIHLLPGDSGIQGSARWCSIGREICLLTKRDRLAETLKCCSYFLL